MSLSTPQPMAHALCPRAGRFPALTAFALALLLLAGPAQAAATSGRELNAFMILSSQSPKEMWALADEIVRQGGRCSHVFAPNAIIGFIPATAAASLRRLPGIVSLQREAADLDAMRRYGGSASFAAAAWNAWLKGERVIAPASAKGEADELLGEALDGPEHSAKATPGLAGRAASYAPNYDQTSEFLIGKVAVGIILPESTGGTENWSADRQAAVVSKIQRATQWWSELPNAPANLSFVYDIQAGVPTSYEPISMVSDKCQLWIPEVMAALGCTNTPGDFFDNTRQYNNRLRHELQTDWAFTVFVVDALNDSDGMFAAGGSFRLSFVYRYYFFVEPYGRPDVTTAHEMAHIFGARDEYVGASSSTATGGYLEVTNSNHELGNPASEVCIMRGPAAMATAWTERRLCRPTQEMVGWRDSDGDGKDLYDPVDTTPLVGLETDSSDPNTGVLTVTGTVTDVPCPAPVRPFTTINTITRVQWRLDGGDWQAVTPSDGAFDSDREDFQFCTKSALPAGTHLVEVSACNSVGNVSATAAEFAPLNPVLPVGPFLAAEATVPSSNRSLWNLTGIYTTTAKSNPLVLNLAHDTTGRLTGSATYTVGAVVVTMPVRGSVKGASGNLRIKASLRGADPTKTVNVALTLALTLDAANPHLTGQVTGSIRNGEVTTPVNDATILDSLSPMSGAWTLRFQLAQAGRKVTGTARLTLPNEVNYAYLVSGRSVGTRVVLNLVGDPADPAAKSLRIKTILTPLEGGWAWLESFSGKGYGQTVTW